MKNSNDINLEIKLLFKELKENPLKEVAAAFVLVSLFPVAVMSVLCFKILRVAEGPYKYLILMVFLSICLGYYLVYKLIIKKIAKVLAYSLLAKRKERKKAEAITNISHELGNPISSIKLSLENLIDGHLGPLGEKQKKTLTGCLETTERMGRLTSNLLELFKIEAGQVLLKKEKVNIIALLENQKREFEPIAEEKKIKITAQYRIGNVFVTGDADKIEQVINNLLSNAVKNTPDGGNVKIITFRDKNIVTIKVCDTGYGMPKEKISTIFDKFTKLDPYKKGAGVGLAISKDIIELHKGKIFAESEQGKGSIFTVLLPI
ncbi:MAG: HAMP domain-containing histidine kinase [Candidatus Omnitrophica bacterium]|nr:HAMP domain-containing histidine kinase [Candidatus Omnitrophota bacterium]